MDRRAVFFVIDFVICHCAIAVNSFEAKGNILREVGKDVEAPSVRLLDASGVAANVGLLQVRLQSLSNDGFGSVCGMNLVRFISPWMIFTFA